VTDSTDLGDTMESKKDVKTHVKNVYSSAAKKKSTCCEGSDSCRPAAYSPEDVETLPQSVTSLSMGCGNPVQEACLAPGEVILDLGSGGGIDVFLAAHKVGPTGKVIGLDFSEDMVKAARENAEKIGMNNVEFTLGELENMPVDDSTVDVIISNCVINLSPDKRKVMQEAFRVLKEGGRISVSDKVARDQIPDHVRNDLSLWGGCIAGAVTKEEYTSLLEQAGFSDVSFEEIAPVDPWYLNRPKEEAAIKTTRAEIAQYVYSALIKARK
jgi:arsenite methyltransferase